MPGFYKYLPMKSHFPPLLKYSQMPIRLYARLLPSLNDEPVGAPKTDSEMVVFLKLLEKVISEEIYEKVDSVRLE